MDAEVVALGDLDERVGQVAGPRGAADLVGDDADLVALGAEAQHRVDEVAAAGAEDPGGPHDRVSRRGVGDLLLPAQLGQPVDRLRVDRVALEPRLGPCRR